MVAGRTRRESGCSRRQPPEELNAIAGKARLRHSGSIRRVNRQTACQSMYLGNTATPPQNVTVT